ncbi:MAG: hypothetical protein V1882_11790 [Candidatus Omnitrophota bacterium]
MIEISFWNVLAVLFTCTILSHGMILLDNGVYWDGWLMRGWFRQKDYNACRIATSQIGLPLYYYCLRFMAMLPRPIFCYKLMSFVGMFLSSFFIYCLCRESGYLTDIQSVCVSILFLFYPANNMMVEPSCMQYGVMHTAFLGACLLGVLAESATGAGQWGMRAGAIVLFFVSFNMNSLLVFYLGFLMLLLFHASAAQALNLTETVYFLACRWYFWIIPFIYWGLKQRYAFTHGFYSDYNLIKFDMHRISVGLTQLFMTGVTGTYIHACAYVAKQSLKWLVPLILASWLAVDILLRHVVSAQALILQSGEASGVFYVGVVLLLAASMPYILVGQRFAVRGFETKNNIILALPMALVVFGSANAVLVPAALPYFLGVVVVSGALYLNYTYLCLLSDYVKNISFLANLAKIPSAKETSVLLVHDTHTLRFLAIDQPEHRPPYLIYMFEWIWGDVTRIGFAETYERMTPYPSDEVREHILHRTTIPYSLQGIDPCGKQALVTVKDGQRNCIGEVRTALKYHYFRFLKRHKLDEYLSRVTQVDLFPIRSDIK